MVCLRWIATLAVLVTASSLGGCSRCSGPRPPEAGTPGSARSDPASPGGDATPHPVPVPGGHAWDVLLEAALPFLESDAVDEALRPLSAALRQLPGVTHVWTRARPGSARLMVRFDRAAGAHEVEATVQKVWDAEPPLGAGPPVIAAIPRGARAAVAYTVLSDAGRREATGVADRRVRPAVAGLAGVRAVRLAGAVRPYTLLYANPTALYNYAVTADRFLPALRAALARQTRRTLSGLLGDATLKRGERADAVGLPAVSLLKLTTLTRGVGEPLPGAQVGPHAVTAVLAIAGADSDTEALFRDDARVMIGGLQRELTKDGLKVLGRNLIAAHRFVLRRAARLGQEPRSAFNRRLVAVLAQGGIHDLVVIDGLDGVPWELDREGRRGNLRTLWLMIDSDASLEEVYDRVSEKIAVSGWRAHLLDGQADTGLLWLLGESATAGALATSRNPQAIAAPIRTLARVSVKARSARNVRTGPRPGRPPRAFATLNRAAAGRLGVPPAVVAELQRLGQGPVRLRRFDDDHDDDNDNNTWLALPEGAVGHRNGDMPLGPRDASVRWQELLQLPDEAPRIDRIREDGKPALWVMLDSALEPALSFTDGFWQTAQRLLEPSPEVIVRPLRLDQVPIQEGQEGQEGRGAP